VSDGRQRFVHISTLNSKDAEDGGGGGSYGFTAIALSPSKK
jgi:hypothetical protein